MSGAVIGDTASRMRELLAELEPVALEIVDDSALHAGHEGAQSGGGHFRLSIVSPRFAGKNTLLRHRLVYAALAPLMHRDIHALAIAALAPGE
jgi:BolA family transcriptional regulator, general stress-responsive regulator